MRAARLALALPLLALLACDALGNPPRVSRTPQASTQHGALRLVTRSDTVPVARVGELLARVADRPHAVEPLTAPFVTLVVVEVEPPGAILPRRVLLETTLTSEGGVERHRWAAPGAARPFVALFATGAPPRVAVTVPAR